MRRILLAATFFCFFSGILSAQISISPSIVNFFNVFQGLPDTLTVTISNNSTTTLEVTDIHFYHGDAFTVSETQFNVAPGNSKDVLVICDPRHNVRTADWMLVENVSHPEVLSAFAFAQGKYIESYYVLTENKWHEDLKTALKTQISFGTNDLGYNGARDEVFMVIDNQRVNGQNAPVNTIDGVYTGMQAVGYIDRIDCQNNYNFNTEHTFPQAFFSSNPPMQSDMHHLFPVNASANQERGNNPFGVVAFPSWQNGGSKSNGATFEPRDEQKGAAARALFYFVLRYQDFNGFVAPQENILRTWHWNFPPDSIQMKRNEDIFSNQNNRNPFIDHPELLERIASVTTFDNGSMASILYTGIDTLAFGSVNAGSQRDGHMIISNQGIDDLVLSNLSFGNAAFNIIGSPNLTIPADTGRIIPIRFAPSNGNTDYTTTFTFSTNDPDQPTGSITLLANSFPVSIEAGLQAKDVRTYPNPAESVLYIELPEHLLHSTSIQLTGLRGDVVKSLELPAGEQKTGMDLADVPSGFYLLRLTNEGTRAVKKVVVH